MIGLVAKIYALLLSLKLHVCCLNVHTARRHARRETSPARAAAAAVPHKSHTFQHALHHPTPVAVHRPGLLTRAVKGGGSGQPRLADKRPAGGYLVWRCRLGCNSCYRPHVNGSSD
eukprot:COSAG02_NODE_7341_length_3056_cov_4.843422_1_plen_116_part_00